MEKLRDQILLFCSFFMVFLLLQFFPATSQEVEETTEFDYIVGSPTGPEHWGDLHPDWSTCNTGEMQSPIDLMDEKVQVVSEPERIRRNYKAANGTLNNRGHDIMLKWNQGEAGFIEIKGTKYFLQQCHWHTPSEHAINGILFDLELHLLHQSQSGQLVVVAVTYHVSRRSDSFLLLMSDHIKGIVSQGSIEPESHTVVGVFDPSKIRIGSQRYYKYIGSLTTPPCTQNVLWFVSKRVRPVRIQQINLLRIAVHDGHEFNARPIQEKNDRPLQLYVLPRTNN